MYKAILVTADLIRGNRIMRNLRARRRPAKSFRHDASFYRYCLSMGGIRHD